MVYQVLMLIRNIHLFYSNAIQNKIEWMSCIVFIREHETFWVFLLKW